MIEDEAPSKYIRAVCPCGMPFSPDLDHQGHKKRGGLTRLYCSRQCASRFVALARRERVHQTRLLRLRIDRAAAGYTEFELS